LPCTDGLPAPPDIQPTAASSNHAPSFLHFLQNPRFS
jgi:hypothetical protein